MAFRVPHEDDLDDSHVFQFARGRFFERTNRKCHLCILQLTCRPLCNVHKHNIHLTTLLTIVMPRYYKAHLNTKCREVTLVMKLLIINVTQNMPQNRVSDTITHVTLNTMNGGVRVYDCHLLNHLHLFFSLIFCHAMIIIINVVFSRAR